MVARLRLPWRIALAAQTALPASDFGPVEWSQGCQRRMSADWRKRRSGVQPAFAAAQLRRGKPFRLRATRFGGQVGLASSAFANPLVIRGFPHFQ